MLQDKQNKNKDLEVISEDTSKRITSLRFLLSVLVVFIHNNYTVENIAKGVENGDPNVYFVPNHVSAVIQNLISVDIARCAVPLFFFFAAFLQAKKADTYKILLKKKLKGIVLPYFIWIIMNSFIYCFVKFLMMKFLPEIIIHPEDSYSSWTFMDWIHRFFGYKSLSDRNPLGAEQFWFLRDLFILFALTPVWNFLIKKFKFTLLFFSAFFYLISFDLFFITSMGLFFYVLGLYLGGGDLDFFQEIDKINWLEIIIVFIIVNLLEKSVFVETITSCLLMLKFSSFLIKSNNCYYLLKKLSGYSFFLYAIHNPFLMHFVRTIWLHIFPMKNWGFCLFEYFGVSIITIVIGTSIGIILKKICPHLFFVLNGGRG